MKNLSLEKDIEFMNLAIHQARLGVKKGQTPFGAVIVYQGKVVAATHNQVWKRTDITAHAEVMALRQACRKTKQVLLPGATIYSTCEPCPMCLSACHWARIKRIVYGARISDAARFGFNELAISNRRMVGWGKLKIVLEPGFLREACLSVFREWQATQKRSIY